MCDIYINRCFPLDLFVIFVTGPSLHCLEGNSLECSIRQSATHHPLFSDLHPSLRDDVHGPFFINWLEWYLLFVNICGNTFLNGNFKKEQWSTETSIYGFWFSESLFSGQESKAHLSLGQRLPHN